MRVVCSDLQSKSGAAGKTNNVLRASCQMQGWDKTYCLQFVEADGFDDIHFFGDKTFEVIFPSLHHSAL